LHETRRVFAKRFTSLLRRNTNSSREFIDPETSRDHILIPIKYGTVQLLRVSRVRGILSGKFTLCFKTKHGAGALPVAMETAHARFVICLFNDLIAITGDCGGWWPSRADARRRDDGRAVALALGNK
jgi:hypothetical protein